MSFFAELKRRNVFRVGIAYVVIAWLIAQVADLVLDNIESPEWVMQVIMLFLAIGLPLALFFAWAFEMTPEGLKKEKDVDRSQSITHHTGRKLDYTIIALLAVGLVYFAWESRFKTDEPATETSLEVSEESVADVPAGTPAEEPAATPAPAAVVDEKSVAVLPFVNMSSDPEQEYFSDGISEEILNALARVKELKVAGRTSSFSFKGKNEDLRTIGGALGVAHILEGSVRKSGNTVRITAQLIKVDDGFHLWSDTYDREMTDIFAIQDEISAAILDQMKLHLVDTVDQPQLASARADLEAYNLYLLAKQNMYTRKEESLQLAERLLNQAINIDPDYAPAYAQLGITTMLLSDTSYGTIPHNEAQDTAKPLLDKSIELDPVLAEGYAGLGLYYNRERGESDAAETMLRKALDINPGLINASNWLQSTLSDRGELAAARDIVEEMLERDPLYRPAIGNAGTFYYTFGQLDKYHALVERTKLYLPGDKRVLGEEGGLEQVKGNLAVGVRLLEAAWQIEKNDVPATVRFTFGLMALGQWERVLEVGFEWQKIYALTRLGRFEEAGIRATAWFEEIEHPGALLAVMTQRREYSRLVEFVENRWPDLDVFEANFSQREGYGAWELSKIAHAYKELARMEKFGDVLGRIRAAHEHQLAQGANNDALSSMLAVQAMLEDDPVRAMDLLEQAREQGMVAPERLSNIEPVFAPLNGEPRFEKLHDEMLAHVNRERAKLDLAPLEPEPYL
jgi:TolB-like protein